jgi:hypothetical protein
MNPVNAGSDQLVHSFLFLRRAVGLIGMALPVVVILGELIIGDGRVLYSVSGYYNSDMRDVYVGALCAIGVFLLSYRGYGPVDDIAGNIGAVAAIGAALFPTKPPGEATRSQEVINAVHIAFGGIFLLTLAFFCLFLFVKTNTAQPTRRKIQRNQVYRSCGVIIVVSLALIVVLGWVLDKYVAALRPVLWLEALASVAFGIAWLTKGEAFLRDLSTTPA